MGLARIDFGNDVEVGGKTKALASSPTSGWLAEVQSVSYTKSKSSDNVGVEVVYKITDEDAVDVDGTPFKGRQWDTLWFSEKSLKITKLKLLTFLGADDTNNLVIETNEDIQDLAETLRDVLVGQEFALVTEAKENNWGTGTYPDGTQKYKSEVSFVNEVS